MELHGAVDLHNASGGLFRAGRGQGPVTSSVFALRALLSPPVVPEIARFS